MRTARPAHTLMEMMVVMAIIVIVAAISIPVMQSMLTDSSITAAGDEVRAKLAEARASAMSEGRPWRLAFIPNTGTYQLAPEESSEWENPVQDEANQPDLIRGALPKGIVFSLNQEDIMNNPDRLPGGGNWETIAIYEPQGNTRDDTTVYFGKPGLGPNRVKVRSLTGAVSMEIFNLPADQP
jgi:type II secretory pathway pseudopilin PulG